MMALEMFFTALSDRSRLEIVLFLLNHGSSSVQEITKALGRSQSLISHHLACLRNCGVVKVERRGKYSYYSIANDAVASIVKLAIEHAMRNSRSILACDVINEEKVSVNLNRGL